MNALVADDAPAPPETLRGLVDTLDGLERRIFGGRPPGDRMISRDGLVRILRQAGKNYRSDIESAVDSEAQRLDLSYEVRRVIESKDQADRPDQLLSLSHAARLQVVEHLFRCLENGSNLDLSAYRKIDYLKVAVAQILVTEPDTLQQDGHPARQFLESLVNLCKGYDRYSGQRADALMERVGRLVEQAVESLGSDNGAFDAAGHELSTLLDAFDRETVAFAKRLVLEEKDAVLKDDAKLAVNREILTAVTGKKLPLILLQFLQQVWNKYLYITYLRHGLTSPEWKRGVEDIHTLVYGFSIRTRDELTRFYRGASPKPLTRIRSGAASIHADEALVKKFFWALDTLHLQITEGNTPSVDDFVTMAHDGVNQSFFSSAPDESRLQSVNALHVGNWFKLPENGLEMRFKLIERDIQHGYCLFSNFSGTKVAMRKFSEVADAVRTGTLKPIDTAPVFDNALAYACRQIAEQIPKLEAKAQQTEHERTTILKRKRQGEEATEHLRRLEEERLRQKTQLLEEKHRREQQHARRESEARTRAEDSVRDEALQRVLTDIERMQPGGWAKFIDDDGQAMTCKLALRFRSSGKMIFVGQLGRKMHELLPEAIARRILEGTASIVDYGVAYDHGLHSLISERDERFDDEQ